MPGTFAWLDEIIGVQSAMGGRGGGLRYLLRDEFTTDRAAGAVNGTAAEPSGGTRVAVDTNSKLTIASGLLTFATGGAGASDPGYWLDSVARAAGQVLVAQVTPANTNGSAGVGWDSNQSGAINDAMRLAASGALNVVANGGTAYAVGTYTAASLKVAAVMRATGVYWFVYVGGQWILKAITAAGTGAGYPAIVAIGTTSIFTSDYLRVPTAKWLPTPLLSDGFGSAFGTSDGLGHAEGIAGGIGAGGSGVTLSNAGGTWSVSGGKTINTPSMGAELLTDAGLEGSYSGGLSSVLAAQGTQTDVENTTDQRSGSKCQQFTPAAWTANVGLYQGASKATLETGRWYRFSLWTKRIAGSAGNSFPWLSTSTGFSPSSGIPYGGEGSSTYVEYARVARCTNASSWKLDLALCQPDASPDTMVVDDLSIKPLVLSELMSLSNLSCSDVYAGVSAVISGSRASISSPIGLVLNADSASNPQNFILVYLALVTNSSNYKIYVEKCVAGVYTTVSSTTFTYSAGARLVCTMNAGALRVYYNGALITTATIVDAGILTGQLHGLFSTAPESTLDDLVIYATGVSGEYGALDAY